ncbi:MAG: hypothetical protein GY720_01705 [bacterium]|nr:hypothetical protein [bacterium]
MHELHTSAFSALLLDPCDACGFPPAACETPYALGDKGKVTYPGGKDVIAEWPRCPRNWHVARRWGGTAVTLSMLCDYAVERGLHREPLLGAQGHRLLMEHIRIKETPRTLMEIKRFEEKK